MSLDPMPSTEQLLRMKAEREQRARQPFAIEREPAGEAVAFRGVRGTIAVKPGYGREMDIGTVTPMEGAFLRIPWSALVSDNAKLRAAIRWYGKEPKPTVVLTGEYREARDRIARLAKDAMDGRPALTVPLALVAEVWVPDNRHRDVVNFSKALHDALQGVVYENDAQLHDVRWLRKGVDVDAPRCTVTITPIRP